MPRSGPISTSRAAGHEPETIAFKLRSSGIDWLPAPEALCRDFRLFAALRGHPSARRPHCARRHPLVGPAAGFPDRDFEPRQGAAGEERRHRAARRQRRLRAAQAAGQPRGVAGRGHRLLQSLRLKPAFAHRQSRARRNRAARAHNPARWGRSLPRSRRRQGHGHILRHRQRYCALPQFLARRCLCERRLGGLRPQGDGHHGEGRLGSGEAPFPRDEHRHSDNAVHGCGRRRHVRRCVRERHAAVENDQARGRVRSPRHFHRPRSRPRRKLRGAPAPVRSAAFELAGLQPRQDFERRRRL